MRPIRLLTAVTGVLVLASACSDGSDSLPGPPPPPENEAPVANFTVPPCAIGVACSFASTSTDDAAVTEWAWDFDGDGNAEANTANASFIYDDAGSFQVSLRVGDAEGMSHTKTNSITIAPPEAPANTPPAAGFTYTCDAATCAFISTSSDAAPGTIVTHAWTFGDGATADVPTPSHGYTITATSEFTVTLTVTDNQGATDAETETVTVSPPPPPPPNTPPTAGFIHSCTEAKCLFTSTSTDAAPGSIVSHAWDFGDGSTDDEPSPIHRYALVNPTNFTVTLTVTDNDGATDVETQTISVLPPPPGPEGCTTTMVTRVECRFNILERSTITLRLIGVSCTLKQQKVVIPPPSGDQVFLSVCHLEVGDSTRIFGGPGDTAFIYEAGSQVTLRFGQGTADPGEPPPGAPAGQVTGTFPLWTISFEDGENAGAPGEPDFADVVIQAEAVPKP